MARIRTIKPEFPLSEKIGRLSRDGRLLFIQLWTICDDDGRARAASRILASLLYPFDTDAPSLIDQWLTELEREGLIVRYVNDGSTYLEVAGWKKHQKIDKPSASRLPSREASRSLDEVPRTLAALPSILDLGPSIKDAATQTAEPSPGTPLDFKKELWSRGVLFLKAHSIEERDARSIIGRWRKSHGDLEVLNALASAEGASVSDPIPYVTAVLAGKAKPNGTGQPRRSAADIFSEFYREGLQERAHGNGGV